MSDFSDLTALFVNCTLKRSPEPSHTQALADRSIAADAGARRDGRRHPRGRPRDRHRRLAGHDRARVAGGRVAALFEQVMAADILVLTTPIWLGEKAEAAAWLGGVGPGPTYSAPPAPAGPADRDFTNRNTDFMTLNLMHVARLLRDAGGFPVEGNSRTEWDAEAENPEHRCR